VSPELVRRLCWDWQGGDIDAFLRDGGARPWQLELAVPALAEALTPSAST
jgi:ribonuclease D